MTKKDFVVVAASIKSVYDDCDDEEKQVVEEVARSLAIDFQDINPRFDRKRFLEACGIAN